MRALVIAPQPFFSPRGTPFSVYYRTLVTSELGVKVDLLTYGEGQDVDIPGVRVIRIPRFPFLGDVKVGPSLLKLFLDIIMVIWTVGLLLRHRYDFVHAHEEAVFFCRFLKPIFSFKLVYDMHSSLPQQLTNFKFTTSKTIITLFKKLEVAGLEKADAIITICPDLAGYVNWLIRDRNKHLLIENSIFDQVRIVQDKSPSDTDTAASNSVRKIPAWSKNKQLVVYAGTLEPYQGIDILINAFEYVISKNPQALLLIVGGTTDQVKESSSLAEERKLGSNCIFTGRVSQPLAKYYSSLASVLVSPRSEGTNTPLKIYEQLASGTPLVATNIRSHTQVLNDEVALLVEPEPRDMARGILAALRSNEGGSSMPMNARSLYHQKYSRPAYVRKMKELLDLLK